MGKNKNVVGTGKGRFHGVKRKELKLIIRRHEARITSLTNDVEVLKARETKWKQQRDAEEYYKKQAEEKATKQALKVVLLEQKIALLEQRIEQLDSLESNKITYIGQMPGSLVMGNDGQLVEKPADVDEAVEWAKRNGHHFPEGKPEKDRMASVVVKSADEISEENRKKAEDTLGFVG